MKQWSLRITAYADRLLNDLKLIDWPDSIKEIQRNWIGKSYGASINFKVEKHEQEIEVFTTRPDTIYGVSFIVLAPEHNLVNLIVSAEEKETVQNYCEEVLLKTEKNRQLKNKKISGVFTGSYAIHPFSEKKNSYLDS